MQEEKILDIQVKYRAIITNCRSYYFFNSLIEFDRRRVNVVALTLLEMEAYITIFKFVMNLLYILRFLLLMK